MFEQRTNLWHSHPSSLVHLCVTRKWAREQADISCWRGERERSRARNSQHWNTYFRRELRVFRTRVMGVSRLLWDCIVCINLITPDRLIVLCPWILVRNRVFAHQEGELVGGLGGRAWGCTMQRMCVRASLVRQPQPNTQWTASLSSLYFWVGKCS